MGENQFFTDFALKWRIGRILAEASCEAESCHNLLDAIFVFYTHISSTNIAKFARFAHLLQEIWGPEGRPGAPETGHFLSERCVWDRKIHILVNFWVGTNFASISFINMLKHAKTPSRSGVHHFDNIARDPFPHSSDPFLGQNLTFLEHQKFSKAKIYFEDFSNFFLSL